jgi:Tol biopolymer transport system component
MNPEDTMGKTTSALKDNLPIHRHTHKSRSSVYAYPSEIEAWRAGRRVVAEPSRLAWPWRPWAFSATTLLCLIMAGSGFPPEAASAQSKQDRQIWVSAVEGVSESVPSADGRYVAYTDWNTGDLGILDLKAGKSRRLTNTGGWVASGDYAESPTVSPDNRQIVYTWWVEKERRAELRVSPVNGGAARTLQRSEGYYKVFGWTPDGKQVLVVRRGGDCQVALVSVQDGSVHVVKSFERKNLSLNASISPDGRYVAYDFPQDGGTGARDIFVIGVNNSQEIPAVQHPANDWAPHWSPDGSRILFLSNRTGDPSLWSAGVENGRPKGDTELVKTGMGKTVLMGVSRAGTLQYVVPGSTNQNIDRVEVGADLKASGPPRREVERFINSNLGPQVSADGKQLAYVSLRAGGAVIVVRDISAGAEREV